VNKNQKRGKILAFGFYSNSFENINQKISYEKKLISLNLLGNLINNITVRISQSNAKD